MSEVGGSSGGTAPADALLRLGKGAAPDWAKRAAGPALRRYGQLTASSRTMPDFLIVGTKRGGTTTLLKYLQLHPGVLQLWPGTQNSKKTWYFDDNFDRPEHWYRSFFATRRHADRVAQRIGYRPISGEAAPYYMYHPLVADRVARTLPSVRVIMLLRNPVDRAHSHWHERRNAGVEPLSFAEALDAERRRTEGAAARIASGAVRRSDVHDFYSYLDRGDYLPQVLRWQAAVGRDNVLLLRSEDLYSDPGPTLGAVQDFLGLPFLVPAQMLHYNDICRPRLHDGRIQRRLRDHFVSLVADLESSTGRDFGWDLDVPWLPTTPPLAQE